ncbi:MAG: hypothetical protein ACI9S8_000552 [Chlamydiales bacterium]|jgi:hypothetical protein
MTEKKRKRKEEREEEEINKIRVDLYLHGPCISLFGWSIFEIS